MISEEHLVAFAPTFNLPPLLLEKVRQLLGASEPKEAETRLAELALSINDLSERLQVLAAFVCLSRADDTDVRPIVAAMAKIKPLLNSGEIKPWLIHAMLDGLLCALIRHIRSYTRHQADATYVEMLRAVFTGLCNQSLKSSLFQSLAVAPPHKVLKRALQQGSEHLGIGLACSPPFTPAGYAMILMEREAAHKRRREWTQELQRLHAVDTASFMAVGSALVIDSNGWPECALMLSCLASPYDRKTFESRLSSALVGLSSPDVDGPALFSIRTMAMLYAAIDAAACKHWPKAQLCLSAYSQLGSGTVVQRKLLKKLTKEFDAMVQAADQPTRIQWSHVKEWLESNGESQ